MIRLFRWLPVAALVFCSFVWFPLTRCQAAEITFPIQESATIDDGLGQFRILINFGDLEALAGKKILYAKLTFQLAGDTCVSGLNDVAIEPVTRQWSSQTVNWLSPWDSAGGDFTRTGAFASAGHAGLSSTHEILLTPLVQAWVDGKRPCHGLVIFALHTGCDIRLVAPANDADSLGGVIFVRYQEHRK
jgi:hypothetical protein